MATNRAGDTARPNSGQTGGPAGQWNGPTGIGLGAFPVPEGSFALRSALAYLPKTQVRKFSGHRWPAVVLGIQIGFVLLRAVRGHHVLYLATQHDSTCRHRTKDDHWSQMRLGMLPVKCLG